MVSDASKKKAAQKKAAAAAKRGSKSTPTTATSSKSNGVSNGSTNEVEDEMASMQISDRTCTGVLASHLQSRDIHIESLTLTFHGHDLIVDSSLELNYGRRYGLLGLNGCGKSTLLEAIGCRELPIPDHMDIYHLTREIEATDMTSLQAVVNVDEERLRLEKEVEILSAQPWVECLNVQHLECTIQWEKCVREHEPTNGCFLHSSKGGDEFFTKTTSRLTIIRCEAGW